MSSAFARGQLALLLAVCQACSASEKGGTDKGGGGKGGLEAVVSVTSDRNARNGYIYTHRELSEVARAGDGTPEAHGFLVHADRLPLKYGIEAGNFGPRMYYPPLRAGDIIPAYGRLNTVDQIQLPEQDQPATFSFTKLEKPPAGLSVLADGLAVPLSQAKPGFAVLRSTEKEGIFRMWVTDIVPPNNKDKVSAKVDVELGKTSISLPATIREGDVLMFGTIGHEVRSIVPRDTKSRVIGWVEFAPQALNADDAAAVCAKTGGKVVRPEKP
jgi:hypothetical protein